MMAIMINQNGDKVIRILPAVSPDSQFKWFVQKLKQSVLNGKFILQCCFFKGQEANEHLAISLHNITKAVMYQNEILAWHNVIKTLKIDQQMQILQGQI